MAAMIEGARFVEIKQAGHIANIEQPATFNAAVGDFFDAIRWTKRQTPGRFSEGATRIG
jgi:hypothetical protein